MATWLPHRYGRYGRGLSVSLVVVAAIVAGSVTASIVVHERRQSPVANRPGTPVTPGGGGHSEGLPKAGAFVPAFDLASDPVFPNLSDGYAIERHTTGGITSEHLAESRNGGHSWYLTGRPFPFESGYSQVQFNSLRSGYAFGPAGMAITHDGGRSWQQAATLGGALQRVVPIGTNVWATYAGCSGPPVPATVCSVSLGISFDGGLHWHHAGRLPLTEAHSGGNILARVTTTKAYVLSYGVTGGGLALTVNSGRSWQQVSDPCARWRVADLAALSGGDLWLICGGPATLDGSAGAKAVYRSFDGGHHYVLEASTGFGPASVGSSAAPSGGSGGGFGPPPYGHLAYAGQLSQLATISPSRAWIGVSGVGVLVTNDYGHIWELARGIDATGDDAGVGVTFNDAEHGWAIAFHDGVWKTSDAVDWQLVDGK